MSEEQPKVWVDFEFVFKDGTTPPAYFSTLEGRDRVTITDEKYMLTIEHDEHTTEYATVQREGLAYSRQVRRVVRPESTVEDSGRLKVSGTVQ